MADAGGRSASAWQGPRVPLKDGRTPTWLSWRPSLSPYTPHRRRQRPADPARQLPPSGHHAAATEVPGELCLVTDSGGVQAIPQGAESEFQPHA